MWKLPIVVVSYINHQHRDEQIRRELDSLCLNLSSKLGNSMQRNTAREAATMSCYCYNINNGQTHSFILSIDWKLSFCKFEKSWNQSKISVSSPVQLLQIHCEMNWCVSFMINMRFCLIFNQLFEDFERWCCFLAYSRQGIAWRTENQHLDVASEGSSQVPGNFEYGVPIVFVGTIERESFM